MDNNKKIQILEEEIFQDKQNLNKQLLQIEDSYQNTCSCFNEIMDLEEECCKFSLVNVQNNLDTLADYNEIKFCFEKQKEHVENSFQEKI